jgi:hypothetical protein
MVYRFNIIAKAGSPVSFPLSLSQVPNNLKFVTEYLPEKKINFQRKSTFPTATMLRPHLAGLYDFL